MDGDHPEQTQERCSQLGNSLSAQRCSAFALGSAPTAVAAVAIQQNNSQPKEGNTKLGSKHRWRKFHHRSRRGLTFNLQLSLRFSVAGLKMRRLMGFFEPEPRPATPSPWPANRLSQICGAPWIGHATLIQEITLIGQQPDQNQHLQSEDSHKTTSPSPTEASIFWG